MRKLLVALSAVGCLAWSGGAVFLFVRDFDVFSGKLWSLATEMLVTAPGVLVEAALTGSGRDLYSGLLVSIAGAALALGAGGLVSAVYIAGALRSAISRSMKARRARSERGSAKVSRPPKAPARKERRFSLPKLSLSRRRNWFRDGVATLDGDGRESRFVRLKASVVKLAGRLPRRTARQVVVTSGDSRTVIAEIDDDGDFYADLKGWHKAVKASSGRDPSLIEKARALDARATGSVLEKVHEEDPMNAEFLVMMMRAWAGRDGAAGAAAPGELKEGLSAEDAVMTEAVQTVMSEGVEDSSDEGEGVDLDEGGSFMDDSVFAAAMAHDDGEDEGDGDDGGEGGKAPDSGGAASGNETGQRPASTDGEPGSADDRMVALDDGRADEDARDLSGAEAAAESASAYDDATVDTACKAALKEAIRSVVDLSSMAAEVESETAAWPDDLASRADRVECLEVAVAQIEERIEEGGVERVASWVEDGAGSAEWEWLDEHRGDLEAARQAILEAVVKDGSGEGQSTPVATGSGDDDDEEYRLEKSFGWSSASSEDGGGKAPEPPGGTDADDTDDTDDGDDGDGEGRAEGGGEEEREEGRVVEARAATGGDVPEPREEATGDPISGVADPREESDPPRHSGQEVRAAHDPRDAGLDQIEEVEKSDQILTRWCYAAKAAGAADVKIGHMVVERDGARRRVLGVVHMVAQWRSQDATKEGRINLVLRYVPEGDWKLDVSDGIRLIEKNGDYVAVRSCVLDQEEVASSTTVIHFHGPGLPEGVAEKIGERLHVAGKVMSSDEIRKAVFGV